MEKEFVTSSGIFKRELTEQELEKYAGSDENCRKENLKVKITKAANLEELKAVLIAWM